jgi:hypothetical protein
MANDILSMDNTTAVAQNARQIMAEKLAERVHQFATSR